MNVKALENYRPFQVFQKLSPIFKAIENYHIMKSK